VILSARKISTRRGATLSETSPAAGSVRVWLASASYSLIDARMPAAGGQRWATAWQRRPKSQLPLDAGPQLQRFTVGAAEQSIATATTTLNNNTGFPVYAVLGAARPAGARMRSCASTSRWNTCWMRDYTTRPRAAPLMQIPFRGCTISATAKADARPC